MSLRALIKANENHTFSRSFLRRDIEMGGGSSIYTGHFFVDFGGPGNRFPRAEGINMNLLQNLAVLM